MKQLIILLLVSTLLLIIMAAAAAQDTIQIAQNPSTRPEGNPPATVEPKHADYYIIKLKYLSVEQVAGFFKKGGRYERMIPDSVESIAGMPALQSIALKTSNPQDVLTITRLIMQLDQPARSYEITCTAVITDDTLQPVFSNADGSIPTRGLPERLRQLITQHLASFVLYPPLRIALNEQGEFAQQENTANFEIMRDQVQINPPSLLPSAPLFRISQIKQVADNRIDCQFSLAHIKPQIGAPGQSIYSPAGGVIEYLVDKTETLSFINDNTRIAYSGELKLGEHSFRLYLLMSMYRIWQWR